MNDAAMIWTRSKEELVRTVVSLGFPEELGDAAQQPVGRVGEPLDIANMVLYLCSDKAGFITGENICIDGGMTRLMIYHGDNGWNYRPRDDYRIRTE